MQPSSAIAITTTLTDSTLTSNAGTGFFGFATVIGSTIDAVVTRVTASSNANTAFQANSTGGTITMVVADSIGADSGGVGVQVAGNNATAIVSGSSFVRNSGADLLQSSSVLRTAGNNAMTGRGAGDIIGTLTPNPLK